MWHTEARYKIPVFNVSTAQRGRGLTVGEADSGINTRIPVSLSHAACRLTKLGIECTAAWW